MINQAVHERLRRAAREKNRVFYSEIARMVGLNLDLEADRGELGRILGEISEYEHFIKHPLLSVVAVRKDTGCPSPPFFEMAHRVGKYDGNSKAEEQEFFSNELKAVYAYWADKQS